MLVELLESSAIASDECRFARAVGDPVGRDRAGDVALLVSNAVFANAIECEGLDRSRSRDFTTRCLTFIEKMLIENLTVELKGGESCLGVGSDFRAPTRTVIFWIIEPQTQAVFLKVMPGKMVPDSENPGQEATGNFRSGFADLTIKSCRLLDDQNPQVGSFAFEE